MRQPAEIKGYPFKSRFFQIDGYNLAYLDEGSGLPVVMLHGNPTWSFMYRQLILALRDRYRLIVPDHMGCGFSDKPQVYPYRLQTHTDNLKLLLDNLAIEKCILVVHDWGGAIGMGWAGKYPDRVAGLVVLNTAAFRSDRIPLRIAVCRWPLIGEVVVRAFNGFAGSAVTMAVTRKLQQEVADGFLYPYNSWKNRIAVFRFVQDIPLCSKHPSWNDLVRIENNLSLLRNKPMLICWGGKDFCFNDSFYHEWLKRFPEAERHYFADAGHYVLEDAFDRIATLVRDYLQIHYNEH